MKMICRQPKSGATPADWKATSLGEIADIHTGVTPSTDHPEFWNGNNPWYIPTDITALAGKKYLRDTARKITSIGMQSSNAKVIPVNSVIMTSRATIGECAINSIAVSTGMGCKSFVCSDAIHAEFLYYLLSTCKQDFIRLANGSTFNEITKRQIADYRIPVPPKTEQSTIAAALSDMDSLVESFGRIIAKKQLIQQGVMQQLLTGKTRLPEFQCNLGYQKTEIGAIPADWNVTTISTFAGGNENIIDGPFGSSLKNADHTQKGVPVLQGICITNDKFTWRDVRYISTAKAKELYRCNVRVGDLLAVKIGSVGFSAIVDDLHGHPYAIIPANLARIRFNNPKRLQFAYFALTLPACKKRLRNWASYTAQPALSIASFRKFQIATPPSVKEQSAIADVLSDMNLEIDSLEARQKKILQIRQGMMQNLLTGRIRLL